MIELTIDEDSAKKLIRLLTRYCGMHMGVPPAAFKNNYQKWYKRYGWAYDIRNELSDKLGEE